MAKSYSKIWFKLYGTLLLSSLVGNGIPDLMMTTNKIFAPRVGESGPTAHKTVVEDAMEELYLG